MAALPEIPEIERVNVPKHEDSSPQGSLTFDNAPVVQSNVSGINLKRVLYVIFMVVLGVAKLLSRAANDQRLENGTGSTSSGAPVAAINVLFENDLFSLTYPNTWSILSEADFPEEYAVFCEEQGIECVFALLNDQTGVSVFIFHSVNLMYAVQPVDQLVQNLEDAITGDDGNIIAQWQLNIDSKAAYQVVAALPTDEIHSFTLLKDHPNSLFEIVVSARNRHYYDRIKTEANAIIASIRWVDSE